MRSTSIDSLSHSDVRIFATAVRSHWSTENQLQVAITNLISFGGRSNWLDGTLLLATYPSLAVAFYDRPA